MLMDYTVLHMYCCTVTYDIKCMYMSIPVLIFLYILLCLQIV